MDSVAAALLASDSAVLVPVPEAERVVNRLRAGLDCAAAWGVPAHVTVLYPFVAPSAITAATIEVLADAVGSVSAFDCEFPATGWFGEEVIWLAPRPDEPFRALTRAVSAGFPGYLPYGGAYDDLVPHLTVGDRAVGGSAELRAAEADVLRALPIQARVSRVWLMTGSTAAGSWRTVAELPLAAGWLMHKRTLCAAVRSFACAVGSAIMGMEARMQTVTFAGSQPAPRLEPRPSDSQCTEAVRLTFACRDILDGSRQLRTFAGAIVASLALPGRRSAEAAAFRRNGSVSKIRSWFTS